MSKDLLSELEKKVGHAIEVIDLLRLQIDELEEENAMLKADHEKWRDDLASMIQRFDQIDVSGDARIAAMGYHPVEAHD
ncbi:MAG: cell division protein ZapB [Pseudomonadota bacterium]